LRNNVWIWLSGADPDALSQCGIGEQRKYIKLGITVIIPSTLAFCGMFLSAPYIGANNIALRLFVSIIWALIILSIDAFLVSTLEKPNDEKIISRSWIRFYLTAFVRFILAISLGVIISHNLIMKVFEKNIDEELNIQLINQIHAKLDSNRVQIISVNKESKNVLDAYDTSIVCLKLLLKYEANGELVHLKCGPSSGKPNAGFRYHQIEHEIIENQLGRDSLAKKMDLTVFDLTKRNTDEIDSLKLHFSSDYLKRTNAIENIKDNEIKEKGKSTTNITFWALMFFLICIDIVALIAKILMSIGDIRKYLIIQTNLRDTALKLDIELKEAALNKDATYRKQLINDIYTYNKSKSQEDIVNEVQNILNGFLLGSDLTNSTKRQNTDFNTKFISIKNLYALGIVVTILPAIFLLIILGNSPFTGYFLSIWGIFSSTWVSFRIYKHSHSNGKIRRTS
jgi:hypothetical protein